MLLTLFSCSFCTLHLVLFIKHIHAAYLTVACACACNADTAMCSVSRPSHVPAPSTRPHEQQQQHKEDQVRRSVIAESGIEGFLGLGSLLKPEVAAVFSAVMAGALGGGGGLLRLRDEWINSSKRNSSARGAANNNAWGMSPLFNNKLEVQ
jgi:hypothetical protein